MPNPEFPDVFCQILSVGVFHSENDVAEKPLVGTKAHRCGEGRTECTAAETPLSDVREGSYGPGTAGASGVGFMEEGRMAGRAEWAGLAGKRHSADVTDRRIKEIQESLENRTHATTRRAAALAC